MTAARKILLLLFCTTASFALAAQEAKDDASKSEDKPKTEQKNPVQPGQIPMITFPGQQWGQNPWTFGGAPGGRDEKKDDGQNGDTKDEKKNDNPWQNAPWGQPGGGFGGFGGGPGSGNPWEQSGFGGFGGGPGSGNPWEQGGFGGFGGGPGFNPWDDGPMFFGGGGSFFGMDRPWENRDNDKKEDKEKKDDSSPFGGRGRSVGGLFGPGNPWTDIPVSPLNFGFGGPGMGSGFGGGFGPGMGNAFGGGQ
ncbi:MAG: hypothetical protein IKL85_02910, partial [Lentisphaeria bacterium]|nr:hypothetical protein [Lentisphaeria bacterium]